MNPTATQIVFSTTQVLLGFIGLLASSFGVAFTLGRFSKTQEILAGEVRDGFKRVHISLETLNDFREDSIQTTSGLIEWQKHVDRTLTAFQDEFLRLRKVI